ncbi:ATP-binding protein [Streptomyces sp. NPDC001536]|uniref:ATP-binding protein n=1 Tax=Streptomyces sp. NPDC001536 TaxID=3364583 RepID=UPI00369B3246
MPSPQPAARPANHRRRRGRRSRIDRYFLDEVAGALYAPLACVIVLTSVTILTAWAFNFALVQISIGLAGSVIVTVIVGGARVHAVAASLQANRDADFELISEAVAAAEKSVIWTAEELCRGKRPLLPKESHWEGSAPLTRVLELVSNLQVQGAASLLRVHDESQAAVLVTMHQTLTRRQHALIGEMLEHLTLLQKATDDAVLLDRSFKIDHLATRLRRMVESVSVVLGGKSLRETRAPVPVSTVLRGAKSETVKYPRVQTAGGDVGATFALPAHVHPDVTHLLAELIDNGLDNSDPESKVTVRVQKVAHGLVFEVEDRALLLMDPAKRDKLNELLLAPSHAVIADQVRHGSLGLITAGKIAEKYDLKVWLTMNPTGGTTANVVVPNHLLVPITPVIGTISVSTEPPPPVRELAHAGAPGQPPPPSPGAAVPSPQPDTNGVDRLPRRKREQVPRPDAGPSVPPPAANPQAGADWRSGLRAGLQGEQPPTQ